jgi:hypothetical protein
MQSGVSQGRVVTSPSGNHDSQVESTVGVSRSMTDSVISINQVGSEPGVNTSEELAWRELGGWEPQVAGSQEGSSCLLFAQLASSIFCAPAG